MVKSIGACPTKSVTPSAPSCLDLELKEYHSEPAEETYLFNS